MSDKPRLLLVDGYSLIFRTFHSIKSSLTDEEGVNVAALYGATRLVLGLIRRHLFDGAEKGGYRKHLGEYAEERFAFVVDAPGKNFRHEVFEDYKANRPPTPPELPPQMERLRELYPALGWPVVEVPGYEADDAIAALTREARDAGYEVLIFTGDKDLMQLIGPAVRHIAHGRKGEESLRDADYVREKFGVAPEKMRDLLALTGDTVDNLPGVPGVGPKKAAGLLEEYGDLESIFDHADEVKGKLGEKLREHEEEARLTWRLVGLDEETPVPGLDELRLSAPGDEARELLSSLRFASLTRELGLAESREVSFTTADDGPPEDFGAAVKDAGRLALIPLGEYRDDRSYELRALRLAVRSDAELLVPCEDGLPAWLGELLNADGVTAIGYALKPLSEELGTFEELMLAGWLLEADRPPRGLADYCQKHLGERPRGGGDEAQGDLFAEPEQSEAAGHAAAALRLWPVLEKKLAEAELELVYRGIELPLTPVLAAVERRGLWLDRQALGDFAAELRRRMEELEERAHELTGIEFNIASPKQVGEVLFDKLDLPGAKKTKTGYSTAQSVLEKLAPEHEIARVILDYRQLAKLEGTYAARLPERIAQSTGRLHTTLHQAAVATGRLSSSDPNLQNIPIRTELGRRIRAAFTAPTGWKLVSADYSQIELRLLAHVSGETRLIEAFRSGVDVHAATAATLFECDPDEVTPEQRNSAKIVNYSLIYGKGVYGLARDLDIGRDEAGEFIDNYFRKYPAVKEWMERHTERVRKLGYTVTLCGRRRPFGEINSPNRRVREAAERAALNAPLQGTAADICKLAMIRAEEALGSAELQARLLLQIHDELLVEAPRGEVEAVSDLLRRAMEQAHEGLIKLSVPLTVELGVGDNWLAAH
ncbi:MAG: DNA polymerase I [Candidatus Coatesbacteria bacterium]|nr:DNA polymerase I [Candidatus Coatesbacteria bacterium]